MSPEPAQPAQPSDRPTIETIARRAGVSIASVSRVLNGAGGRPSTVQAVTRAARELGYVPSAIARSLRSRRTGQVALAVADVADPVYVAMLREIQTTTAAAGYRLVLHITAGDATEEVALLRGLAHRYVDGMILCPVRLTATHLAELRSTPVPVVVVGALPDPADPPEPGTGDGAAATGSTTPPSDETSSGIEASAAEAGAVAEVAGTDDAADVLGVVDGDAAAGQEEPTPKARRRPEGPGLDRAALPVDAVLADARSGAALAVRHLHDAGRDRIAFVNGPQDTLSGHARRLGYLDGIRACGLPYDERLTECCDTQRAAGVQATGRLLARTDPDAIVCATDLIAVGVLHALRAAGRDVPGDVAVVGMDDSDLAQISWPSLTSVSFGAEERGGQAVALLLDRMSGRTQREPPQHVTVEPRLVVRDSSLTAALRATQADLLQH